MTTPIPIPSPDQVQRYLDLWVTDGNEDFDASLRRLFTDFAPRNTDVGDVAIKVSALNAIYATQILGVTQMAEHIVNLGIDVRLAEERADSMLIEDIATLNLKGKARRHYSFATKFCSFHRPDVYPIYDSLVVEVLNGLLKQGEVFDTFEPGDSWRSDYGLYVRSLLRFRDHYGLGDFTLRDIDKYLWKLAKERRNAA